MKLKKYTKICISALLLAAGISLSAAPISFAESTVNAEDYGNTYWNGNSEIFQENREPFHVTTVPYVNGAKALKMAQEDIAKRSYRVDSEYVKNLNGTWDFHFADKVAEKAIQTEPILDPKAFHGTEYAQGIEWDSIDVPRSWQTVVDERGNFKYDATAYSGQGVTWEGGTNEEQATSGYVPEDAISVGTYKRSFTVSESWQGREVFLCFNGVRTAYYVWVNGSYVGYSEDSAAAAQFDVTGFVNYGAENEVVVEVYRYGDAAFLEDQDMLRMSGIYRDVYLFSTDASASIRDYSIFADLDENYEDAKLTIKTYLHSYSKTSLEGYKVKAYLYDGDALVTSFYVDGGTVSKEELEKNGDYALDDEIVLTKTVEVKNPKKWSAEYPNLYNVVLSLESEQGTEVEAHSCNFGFREIEVLTDAGSGLQYLAVNGQKIYFRGVNRHENDVETGNYESVEKMEKEAAQMKQLNVNAVRTSHYTNDPAWFELCSRYGLYMMSESNLESHGVRDYGIPGEREEWKDACIEREKANVIVNKNQPGVIIWSLGNEAGTGEIFNDLFNWVEQYDTTRYAQYAEYYDSNSKATFSPTGYRSSALLKAMLESEKRPVFQTEFAHTQVNGRGGFYDTYIATGFEEDYINYCGGFIWLWKDMSVYTYVDTDGDGIKEPYAGYGNDWGTGHLGSNFGSGCCDGVIDADGYFKPEASDLKNVYEQIKITASEEDLKEGIIHLKNLYQFTNLNEFDLNWEIQKNGTSAASGKTEVSLEPGYTFNAEGGVDYASATVELGNAYKRALEAIGIQAGDEVFLNLSFTYKNAPEWAKEVLYDANDTSRDTVVIYGDRVASEQFELISETKAKVDTRAMDDLKIEESDSLLKLSARNGQVVLTFDKEKGEIVSYQVDGDEMFSSSLTADLYRPVQSMLMYMYTEGYMAGYVNSTTYWREALNGWKIDCVAVNTENKKRAAVDVDISMTVNGVDCSYAVRYVINGDGSVYVTPTLTLPAAITAPKVIGLQVEMPDSFKYVKYFGRGESENYRDRNLNYPAGIYESTVQEQYFPYIEPSESGNRSDVRWVAVTNDEGKGLLFHSDSLMDTSVLPYTTDELDKATHDYELDEIFASKKAEGNGTTVVQLDYYMNGIGQSLLADYVMQTVKSGTSYCYTVGFAPIQAKSGEIYPDDKTIREKYLDSNVPTAFVSDIQVDGEQIAGYAKGCKDYTIYLDYEDYADKGIQALPTISATPVKGAEVTVTLPKELPGKAVIEANYEGLTEIYEIQINVRVDKYLSDMAYKSSGDQTIALDLAANGTALRLCTATPLAPGLPYYNRTYADYSKGIGVIQGSELTFDVSRYTGGYKYTSLQITAGPTSGQSPIDDGLVVYKVADIQYEVLVDGEVKASGIVNMNGAEEEQNPVNITVDVEGAREVVLRTSVANPQPGTNYQPTYFNWCDAKLVRELTPAAGITLSESAILMKAGESKVLTAAVLPENASNQHVKWATSDSSVAAVDENGKVTARKVGTAVITAMAEDGNYEAKCTVTVVEDGSVPGVPTDVKTSGKGAAAIRISWKKVSGANSYEIYRKIGKSGTFGKIAEVSGGKNSYTDKRVKKGKTYYYKIRTCKNNGAKKQYSDFSKIVKRKAKLDRPSKVKAKASKNAVKLSWKKVTKAVSYEVYRSAKKNGKYQKVATVKKKAVYKDNRVTKGKTCYYKIKAVQKAGKKIYRSAFSAKVKAKVN